MKKRLLLILALAVPCYGQILAPILQQAPAAGGGGGSSTPAILQSTSGSGTSSPVTATLALDTTLGSTFIVYIEACSNHADNTFAISNVSDPVNGNWTADLSITLPNSNMNYCRQAVYRIRNTANTTHGANTLVSVAFTNNYVPDDIYFRAFEVSNIASASPLNQSPSPTTGNGTSVTGPNNTTVSGNYFCLGYTMGGTITPGGSWTRYADDSLYWHEDTFYLVASGSGGCQLTGTMSSAQWQAGTTSYKAQ